MAPVSQKRSFLSARTVFTLAPGQDPREVDWQTAGELAIEAYDGSNAWQGHLPRRE